MSDPRPVNELVELGREAAARGSWREAYDVLVAVDPAELAPEDLELIGEATSWSGPSELCIETRERAFGAYLANGDQRSAARLALALFRDYFLTRAGSVAAGWFMHAERLLKEVAECPEHGYLALVRVLIGARQQGPAERPRGEISEAGLQLRRALEIAQKFGDRDLEVLVLHSQGSMLIGEGEVDEGWALIDQAAAAAATGDLRPTATGFVYCWTISACRDLLELRRAGEWTARFEQWCERTSLPGGWRGDCRVHRAQVLRVQGRWTEAEAEAEHACEDFLRFNMPSEVGQAAYELGELHLCRGDLAGAEAAFRRALEAGFEPQPGHSLLRLAEGKPSVGLGELDRALAEVRDDRKKRARLLPAYIELAVTAGDLDKGRVGAEELASLATLFGSDALIATAAWASGIVLLAETNAAASVAALREAVRGWHRLGAPYEAARARTALAEAYRAIGDDDAAVLELEAARSIFERLGAVAETRRITLLLRPVHANTAVTTLLFSDICGSTSLVEAIGDQAWLDLVEWHDRTLRGLFTDHAGKEVDHAGDGFFIVFPDPAAALACAVAIQRTLSEHRRNHGFAPPVRIGVHSAEAIPVSRGLRGKGVHTAARVGAIADANEIVASRETAEAGRVNFTNSRLVEFKGLAEPVEIVSIAWT